MLSVLPHLLFAQIATSAGQPARQPAEGAVYNGRASQTAVRIPRTDSDARIDGVLDEPEWLSAARLTGFSLYALIDRRIQREPSEARTRRSLTVTGSAATTTSRF